jgi:putative zinc finger/helix-turn-helix YgiT family protein
MEKLERKIIEEEVTLNRDGVSFNCKFKYYQDLNGDTYEADDLIDENLLTAQDAYRRKVGLLTSKEIVDIRKKYHLNQKDFANILGIGEIGIARYETKQVQTKAINALLLQARDNPLWLSKMLEENASSFQSDKTKEILAAIGNCASSEQMIKEDKIRGIEFSYLPFKEPSLNNGEKKLDIDAAVGIVSEICSNFNNITKTKLAKIFFYSDFLSYKRHKHSITGLVYSHAPYGALPRAYDDILSLPAFSVKTKCLVNQDEENVVYIVSSKEKGHLSDEDKQIVDEVLNKISGMNTQQIVQMMHEEDAYKKTKPGQIISYEYSDFLKAI